MSPPAGHAINRQLLGHGALALGDDEYARVVAALGANAVSRWPSAQGEFHDGALWFPQEFLDGRRKAGVSATAEQLRTLAAGWEAQFARSSDRRLIVNPFAPPASRLDLGDVAHLLAQPAVGATSVFINWSAAEKDLRWEWPMRVGAFAGDFETLQLAALADHWPAKSLTVPVVVDREHARVEVLVVAGGVRDALARVLALSHRVRAGFLLLLAPCDVPWRDLWRQIGTLLAETQAAGLAIVAPESLALPATLNDWVRRLSHNEPFDSALTVTLRPRRSLLVLDPEVIRAAALPAAARQLGRRLRQLPRSAPLTLPPETRGRLELEWTSTQPPEALGAELEQRVESRSLPFNQESQGGSGISEIGAAERQVERDVAPLDAPRYLQGSVFELTSGGEAAAASHLVEGRRYALDVLVGPPGVGAITADLAFPDEQLEWKDEEVLTLQVLFAEPRQWSEPMRGTIELPRAGTSSTCRFVFSPTQEGPFAARLILYYRGRVLQTALLETVVVPGAAAAAAEAPGEGMRLRVEAELRRSLRTLDERRRFDACLLCNHTSAHQAAIAAAGAAGGAYIASLAKVPHAIARIGELLTQVAHDTRTYSGGLTKKGNAQLLCDLAFEGSALYRTLVIDYIDRSTTAADIKKAEYLQIVTMAPDALVPLEFVYEFPLPRKDAPVCPHAEQALTDGKCPAACRPTSSPAPHVCPMGFWGLSRVIERHIHVPELAKEAKVLGRQRSEPITGRDELSLDGATLLGASQEVPAAKRKQLETALKKVRPGVLATALNWGQWQEEVARARPAVIVALPHTASQGATITLEIGGDTLASGYIDAQYTHVDSAPPPMALLLGCDTATTTNTDAYLSHVEVFRQADAALVLGTVATVLGTDAADMASRLLTHLAKAAKKGQACFGEVLRDAKRSAVAESDMIALCVVAFGDADWKLVPH